MKTGNKIKQLRKEKRLTLGELSKLSGVAIATLSRMEHNIMTGTLDSYDDICKALGTTLSEFFEGLDAEASNLKIHENTNIIVNNSKYSVLNLSTNAKGKMKPLLVNIQPRSSLPLQKSKTHYEKFIYVLEGVIILKTVGKDYSIKKGNSAYFNSYVKHTIINPTNKEAKIISVES